MIGIDLVTSQTLDANSACYKMQTTRQKRWRWRYVSTYLFSNSMLKKTYSPLPTMLSSSAANIISLIFGGEAHNTTTARHVEQKEFKNQQERNETEWTSEYGRHAFVQRRFSSVIPWPEGFATRWIFVHSIVFWFMNPWICESESVKQNLWAWTRLCEFRPEESANLYQNPWIRIRESESVNLYQNPWMILEIQILVHSV